MVRLVSTPLDPWTMDGLDVDAMSVMAPIGKESLWGCMYTTYIYNMYNMYNMYI